MAGMPLLGSGDLIERRQPLLTVDTGTASERQKTKSPSST